MQFVTINDRLLAGGVSIYAVVGFAAALDEFCFSFLLQGQACPEGAGVPSGRS